MATGSSSWRVTDAFLSCGPFAHGNPYSRAAYLGWPLLLAGAIAANCLGMRTAHPMLSFNASYFALAEFGFFWAHRLADEWPLLWRFHAIHHSVTRLWFVNTGRFHQVK